MNKKVCSFCDWESEEVTQYKTGEHEPFFLCKLCANTTFGNAYQYPSQFDAVKLARAMAFSLNVLFDHLKIKIGDTV